MGLGPIFSEDAKHVVLRGLISRAPWAPGEKSAVLKLAGPRTHKVCHLDL
jgi:hypothetical protein